MTQAMAVPANEVQSRPMSLVQDIPLSRIHESKTNPRRQFDELKLAELAGQHPSARGVTTCPRASDAGR
jgi:hypothetical protein